MNKKCVIYARVSTEDQHLENQIDRLVSLASIQNDKVLEIYKEKVSGGNTKRPEFHRMLNDARLKKFDLIYIWSLDRFSRESITNTLSYIKSLQKYGVGLVSLQETWLCTSNDGMGELLIAILSWVASQERKRISERTKAGLARSKKSPGRPVGSKDRKPRRKSGYYNRWSK